MRKLIFLLFLVILLPLVVSQGLPTQVNANTNLGYDIRFPEYNYARVNTTFELHTHVYNRTTGLLLDNSSVACFLHLYNPNGDHILQQKMGYERNITPMGEFDLTILAGNFSMLGTHAYVIQCNSTLFGGFSSGLFDVTYSGLSMDDASSRLTVLFVILYFLSIVVLVFLGSRIPDGDVKDDLGQITMVNYLKYLRNVIFMVSWVLFVYFFYIVSNLSYGYLESLLLAKTFFMLYRILFIGTVIALPLYFWYLFVQLLKDKELTKLLNQGFQP